MPTVVGVRKEQSPGGDHLHITMVCTKKGKQYSTEQVVESLDAAKRWRTQAPDGSRAKIKKVRSCRHGGCTVGPYITTKADPIAANNLDNLPSC